MEIRFHFSTEMKLHFPATATMICLEKQDCAALERNGIPMYQNVKVNFSLLTVNVNLVFIIS